MKQKFFLNDISILFICPSPEYGFVEKRALEDATFIRDIGGKAKIICLQGSKMHEKAIKNDLEVILYKRSVNKKIDLSFFFFINSLLKSENFEIIHSYGLRYIWSVIISLRKRADISLFLTLNKHYSSTYKKAFYLLLLKRVDAIFCFTHRMRELLIESLPINAWKIKVIGTGIDFINMNINKANEGKIKKIGAIIPYSPMSSSHISTLVYAMKPLVDQYENIEIYFFSEEPWVNMPLKQSLVDQMQMLSLDYKILLKEMESYNQVMQQLDVFISIANDAMDDHVIQALARKIPVVLPRTGLGEGIWVNNRKPFETYNASDARELKDKCLKILANTSFYISRIEKFHDEFIKNNDIQYYIDALSGSYEKAYTGRHKKTSSSVTLNN